MANIEHHMTASAEAAAETVLNARLLSRGVPARYLTASLDGLPHDTPGQVATRDRLQHFAKTCGHGSTGLIVLGPPGTGKTWMICALCRSWAMRGKSFRFTTLLGMIRAIRSSWGSSEISERQTIKNFTEVGLLILDEVGIGSNSDAEWSLVSDIVNDRYANCRPTVLLSNLSVPQFTAVVGERLIDRFRDGGEILIVDGPSLRGKFPQKTEPPPEPSRVVI